MVKKSFHFSLKIFLEILFGFFLLWLAVLIAIAGILKNDSFNLDGVLPIIEGRINQSLDGSELQIADLGLEWSGLTRPLKITARNVIVNNAEGPFLHAPQAEIKINPLLLAVGRLDIQNVTISRITVSVTRTAKGKIQITGAADANDTENEFASKAVTLNNIIYDLPQLETLEIREAQVIYIDEAEGLVRHYDPVTIFANMDDEGNNRQLNGYLSFPFGDEYYKNIVRLNFMTQGSPASLNIAANIQDTPIDSFLRFAPPLPDGWDFNMIVNADIRASLNNIWGLEALDMDLKAPRGQIIANYGGAEHLFEVSDLSTHITQSAQDDALLMDRFEMRLDDETRVAVTGQISGLAVPENLAGDIRANVTNMPQVMLDRYWPKTEAATSNGAYNWLVERMSDGVFTDVDLSLAFDRRWDAREDDLKLPAWLERVEARYAFTGMGVDYRAPLTPASNAVGSGTYDGTSIDINIASANIDQLNVRDGRVKLDLGDKEQQGTATISIPVTGPLVSVFDYIGKDPINALDKINFETTNAEGTADVTVDIGFPLQKDLPGDAVKVDVKGRLFDVRIGNIVKGLTLSGGPFEIKTGTEMIELSGSGQLSGAPIELTYLDYFDAEGRTDPKTKITATTFANTAIQKAFIGDLADYIDGAPNISLDYQSDFSGRNAAIDLQLGLQNTALNITPIGLQKDRGEALSASMRVTLQDNDIQSIRGLTLNGPSVAMSNGVVQFTRRGGETVIETANLSSVRYGENNLSLAAVTSDDRLSMDVTGSYLDARPIFGGRKEEQSRVANTSSRPYDLTINVDQMQTADEATLKQVDIAMAGNSDGDIERFFMNAMAGKGNLLVEYTPRAPDANGLSLRVESDNAGDTLRAFNLYKNIYGGRLRIAGRPLQGGRFGDVAGAVRIDDFTVTNTPVLVRLLNALSFREPSNNLGFERLQSNFEWRVGDGGSVYSIQDGRTKGASIGLTFDGVVDTQKGTMDVNGTAAPLSQINNLVGNIPIIGDILTGGGGALLAATYSITGNTDNPSVSVNPLSVLTPGIIRKILFEGGDARAPDPQATGENGAPVNAPRGLN